MYLACQNELRPANPKAINNDPSGTWTCDVCDLTQNGGKSSQLCSLEVCQTCLKPQKHPACQDPLQLTDMITVYPEHQGSWKCDTCFKVFDNQKYAYHCRNSEFDICRECFQGSKYPLHDHTLKPFRSTIIYDGRGWICDSCGKRGESHSKFAWHCEECEFDACPDCVKNVIQSPLHSHPLVFEEQVCALDIIDWEKFRCDYCKHKCTAVYHCFTCQFDICGRCFNEAVTAGRAISPPTRSPTTPLLHHNNNSPLLSEEEDPDEPLENIPDTARCKICFSKRAIAIFIHGSTGHNFACMSCAYSIFRSDGKCPVCREPVSTIVRHYST